MNYRANRLFFLLEGSVCVCVGVGGCACAREREIERERGGGGRDESIRSLILP